MASKKTALVLIVLTLALSYQQTAAFCPSCPKECCFAVRRGRALAVNMMKSYYETIDCHVDAVVLVMNSGKRICVSPEENWVQRAMTKLPNMK